MDVLVLKDHETASFDRLVDEIAEAAAGSEPDGAPLLERIAQDFERLNGYLQAAQGEAARGGMRPACAAGCSYCCYQSVTLSEIEAFALARHIERSGEVEALKQRVAETAARIAMKSASERFREGVPCPLLEVATGRCGAYEARPFICRGHNSTSWLQCKKAFRAGNSQAEIGAVRAMTVLGMIARQGYIDGLNKAGIGSKAVELTHALATIFATPDAYARWRGGEDIFGRQQRA